MWAYALGFLFPRGGGRLRRVLDELQSVHCASVRVEGCRREGEGLGDVLEEGVA